MLVSYVNYDEKGTNATNFTVGQISYDAAGRMSAQRWRRTGRPPRGASDAERAAAAAGYVAYFGRYEIDAARGVVTHHVEGSVSQAWWDRRCPAGYEFSPDGQTLY
jgi:hypothetical protein